MPQSYTVTVADADHPRVHAALAKAHGRDPAQPVIKAAIVAYIQQTVANVERSDAMASAMSAESHLATVDVQ